MMAAWLRAVFLVARGASSELPELGKTAFYELALLIEFRVERMLASPPGVLGIMASTPLAAMNLRSRSLP